MGISSRFQYISMHLLMIVTTTCRIKQHLRAKWCFRPGLRKCIETNCTKRRWHSTWRGTWSMGFASCQKDNYCAKDPCGSPNKCFSLPEEGFLCHCAQGFSGGFPFPDEQCIAINACDHVNCGGESKCVDHSPGHFKCECDKGSTRIVTHLL